MVGRDGEGMEGKGRADRSFRYVYAGDSCVFGMKERKERKKERRGREERKEYGER